MSSSTTTAPAPPSISLDISTSGPTLDLFVNTPFTITAKATLNGTHPITFQKRYAPLFIRPLFTPGLTLKNTRTGDYVPRPTMHIQHLISNDHGLPTQERRAQWMTLYPEQPHTIEVTLEPRMTSGPFHPTPDLTVAEMQELKSKQTPVRKWGYVGGLEDGQTYEIGVSGEAGITAWVVGDLIGVLDAARGGTVPKLRNKMIGVSVSQGASFTVKRPDKDGSLSDVI